MGLLLMPKIFFCVIGCKILKNVSLFTCNQNKDGLFRLTQAIDFFNIKFQLTQNDLKKSAVNSVRRLLSVKINPTLDSTENCTIKNLFWSIYRLIKGSDTLVYIKNHIKKTK